MGFYETTYILHSALQEGRLNDILNTIEKKIESLGAKILFIDNWGRKKLSYLIQKEKYGTYIFFFGDKIHSGHTPSCNLKGVQLCKIP